MTQFLITTKTGLTYDLAATALIHSVEAEAEKGKYRTLTIVLETENKVFDYCDWIEIDNVEYVLRDIEESERKDDRLYEYKLVFYGPEKTVEEAPFIDMDEDGISINKDTQPMCGDIEFWGKVICNNVNYRSYDVALGKRTYQPTLSLGLFPAGTSSKYIEFTEYNAFAALRTIAETFGLSFSLVKNTDANTAAGLILNFGTDAELFGMYPGVLEYGQGKGLYNIRRKKKNDKNIKTILTVLGSTENLPSGYGKSRLELNNEIYPGSIIADPLKIAKYGAINDICKVDDIKPSRTGSITSLEGCSILQFIDSGIDFNPSGGTVNILSGQLAGYNFDVSSYDATNHKVTIKTKTDANGFIIPSEPPYVLSEGDTYNITGIQMPESYLAAAQEELAEYGNDYYTQVSQPQAEYEVDLHTDYIRSAGTRLHVGMLLPIMDTGWGVDKYMQITKLTRDLLAEDDWEYTDCQISEGVEENLAVTLYKLIKQKQQKGDPGQDGQTPIRVEKFTTPGYEFYRENAAYSATLSIHIFQGEEDITGTINIARFVWYRMSENTDGDTIWNELHAHSGNSVDITDADLVGDTSFIVQFWDEYKTEILQTTNF